MCSHRKLYANSADLDQVAPKGAKFDQGYHPFAILSACFLGDISYLFDFIQFNKVEANF